MTNPARVLVLGNGMAGFRFVAELLELAPGAGVTVVGDERGGAYNRARLPLVLAGSARQDSIELADEAWYKARGARLITGSARQIDRARRLVELTDGPALPYDVLVLALGSTPVMPPLDGLAGRERRPPRGVVAFRTLADCAEIRALADGARRAVVLGGGVLGLETARALAVSGRAAGGRAVTLVQRASRLMDRQLDAGAARVLARTVRTLGVDVRAGAAALAVRSEQAVRSDQTACGAGRVTGLVLDSGQTLGADLIVLCCGSRPRTELARAAGLAVGAGIVVDDQMRSVSDPCVFAIGDCAEHRGRTHGLVAAAWAQARIAARTIAGTGAGGMGITGPGDDGAAGSPAADGSRAVIRLKADGVELAVLGSARGGGGRDVIRFTDPARGVYQKLVIRNGRLAGAILLGDTRAAGTLTQLFDRGAVLPADRASLLAPQRDGATPVMDSPVRIHRQATICHCNGVSKAAICAAWQEGARNMAQVVASTHASTGCGTCHDAVEGIVDWLAAAEPDPVPVPDPA